MLKRLISSFFTRAAIAFLNLAVLLVSTRQLGSDIVGQVSLLILNIAIVQIINEFIQVMHWCIYSTVTA